MSINRRWHRADLAVTPLAMLAVAVVVSIVFVIAAVTS